MYNTRPFKLGDLEVLLTEAVKQCSVDDLVEYVQGDGNTSDLEVLKYMLTQVVGYVQQHGASTVVGLTYEQMSLINRTLKE